ncbi:hypothetical protein HGG64_02395 [Mycoplasma phocoeninasale]|uniref:Variable surface lipoprotein n=1 Tax=Mycoplasma phocoeninasale TaxID=2726117 RepID=A0A858U3B5_9MOLU|nr:hypothetical protein [Mycoplasma phocoeninasale]QJG66539.1 hypothetical protein HGG64_02395 [Mycoplasma phocoeninasale]
MKKIKWIIALSLPIVATPLVAAACGSKDMMKDKTPPPKETPKDPMITPPNDGMPPKNDMPGQMIPKDPTPTPPKNDIPQTPPSKDIPPKKDTPQNPPKMDNPKDPMITPPNNGSPQNPPKMDMPNNPNMMMPETQKPTPPVMPKVETQEERIIKFRWLALYYLAYKGLLNTNEFNYDKNEYIRDMFVYLGDKDKKNMSVLNTAVDLLATFRSNNSDLINYIKDQLKLQESSMNNAYKNFWSFLDNIYNDFVKHFNKDENFNIRVFLKYWEELKTIGTKDYPFTYAGYWFQILFHLNNYSHSNMEVSNAAKSVFDQIVASFTKPDSAIVIANIEKEVSTIKNYLENLDNTSKK